MPVIATPSLATPSLPTRQPGRDVDHRAFCPHPVPRPCMIHRWDQLTFLHWRYAPAVVQRLLPRGLEVETIDGSAWVGLVPFVMLVRPPGTRPLPWISHFPETNVRTYVRAADGSTGVRFLSLDAARLPAVVTARLAYRLPYFWSSMTVEQAGDRFRYQSRRRWPAPVPATSDVEVIVGDRFTAGELTDLDHRLTAQWNLYTDIGDRIWSARAEHPPWALHRAEVIRLDDSLVTATGLPAPEGAPLVHHSPGTEVRVSSPLPLR